MLRRDLALLVAGLLFSRSAAAADVAAGLTEALVVGTDRTVDRLGKPGGFLNDPKARIPLPGPLEKARTALKAVGLSGAADDLEVRMNKAAEEATPIAKNLIVEAIHGLTFEDAMGILNGPKDSATRYLERKTGPSLSKQMRPIVDHALADVGAIKSFDSVVSSYKSLPFGSSLNIDLTGYVVSGAQKAIFMYIGQEEAAIRTNPAARTTALLKSVFGG